MATKRSIPTRIPGGGGTTPDKPTFESPYKPPPGYDDLAADIDAARWYEREAAQDIWRVRVPAAAAVHAFAMAISKHNKNSDVQLRMMKDFIQQHMHPEDFERMLLRMVDTDNGGFPESELWRLIRVIATTGTARPFGR